jgi:hypothetical protein
VSVEASTESDYFEISNESLTLETAQDEESSLPKIRKRFPETWIYDGNFELGSEKRLIYKLSSSRWNFVW